MAGGAVKTLSQQQSSQQGPWQHGAASSETGLRTRRKTLGFGSLHTPPAQKKNGKAKIHLIPIVSHRIAKRVQSVPRAVQVGGSEEEESPKAPWVSIFYGLMSLMTWMIWEICHFKNPCNFQCPLEVFSLALGAEQWQRHVPGSVQFWWRHRVFILNSKSQIEETSERTVKGSKPK